jgi:acetolactate synthase-1/2/3 large subunit
VNHDGPAFLEVITDQGADVFPMVGPGMGYKDMITGPHIKPRDTAIHGAGDMETSDIF